MDHSTKTGSLPLCCFFGDLIWHGTETKLQADSFVMLILLVSLSLHIASVHLKVAG